MQAVAEESKNEILARINRNVDRVESQIQESFERTTLTILVVVMILLVLIAAMCWNWTFFGLVVIYVVVMSFIYIQFTREYTKKRLRNASRTVKNFLASESAIEILNNAGQVYVSTSA